MSTSPNIRNISQELMLSRPLQVGEFRTEPAGTIEDPDLFRAMTDAALAAYEMEARYHGK